MGKELAKILSEDEYMIGLVDTVMAKEEGFFWVASSEKSALQIYKAIESKKELAYVTNQVSAIFNYFLQPVHFNLLLD